MTRKDCEVFRPTTVGSGAREPMRSLSVCVLVASWVICLCVDARAGAVRLWPTAVVVSDTIRLDDVCVLQGFDADSEAPLSKTIITEAPAPGGSRIVHLEMIRSALAAQGVNLADVTLSGALRCSVTRPAAVDAAHSGAPSIRGDRSGDRSVIAPAGRRGSDSRQTNSVLSQRDGSDEAGSNLRTLRAAVIDHFNDELIRFHGKADISFDRTDEQVLDLSGPDYAFRVRPNGSAKLGLVSLDVDVLSGDRIVQTVPLLVQASMVRPTVVARRAINQGAAIQASDVDIISLQYAALNRLGIDDPQRVVGQRARRLIRAGSTINPDMLERVPLVVRGQLVSVASVVGGVRVVTSGKASGSGHLGDVVTVRPTDRRRVEFDATVVGPGQVQLGGRLPRVASADGNGGGGS